MSVLHHAFVGAFARSLEGSISLRDVRKNLEGIGEGDAKQQDKEDEKRTAAKEKPKPGPKRPT